MTKLLVRDCPTCGSEGRKIGSHSEPNPTLYGIQEIAVPLRVCDRCGLKFFDLIEGVNANGEIYSRMVLSTSRPKRRHKRLAALIDRNWPMSYGLEIGAGACHISALLPPESHRIVALDYYDGSKPVENHVHFVNADCTALSGKEFDEETFDWILADNILEHLPSYRNSLDHCIRWLKKGGFIIICVPNTHTLARFVSKRHQDRIFRPVEHVNNFTDSSLDFLLSALRCQKVRANFPIKSLFDASMWISINWVSPFGIYKVYRKSEQIE